MNDRVDPSFDFTEDSQYDTYDTDTLFSIYEEDSQEVPSLMRESTHVNGQKRNNPAKEVNGSRQAQTYIAHYTSPANSSPAKGFFEYESVHRVSSKDNHRDARIKMLSIYGEKAVSWIIDEQKLKRESDRICGDQLELDFRKPARRKRRRKAN